MSETDEYAVTEAADSDWATQPGEWQMGAPVGETPDDPGYDWNEWEADVDAVADGVVGGDVAADLGYVGVWALSEDAARALTGDAQLNPQNGINSYVDLFWSYISALDAGVLTADMLPSGVAETWHEWRNDPGFKADAAANQQSFDRETQLREAKERRGEDDNQPRWYPDGTQMTPDQHHKKEVEENLERIRAPLGHAEPAEGPRIVTGGS